LGGGPKFSSSAELAGAEQQAIRARQSRKRIARHSSIKC
jgi:hypothetical protein